MGVTARSALVALVATVTAMSPVAANADQQVAPIELAQGSARCEPVQAVDGDGVLVAAHDMQVDGTGLIVVRRWDPQDGWGKGKVVSDPVAWCQELSVVSDGRVAMVSWADYGNDSVPSSVNASVRPAAGSDWTPSRQLSIPESQSDGAGNGYGVGSHWPVVVDGTALVAWDLWGKGSAGWVPYAVWRSGNWTPQRLVAPRSGAQLWIRGLAAVSGGAVALVGRDRGGRRDWLSYRWSPTAGWSRPTRLADPLRDCGVVSVESSSVRVVAHQTCRQGATNSLWARDWANGAWTGPTRIGAGRELDYGVENSVTVVGARAAIAYTDKAGEVSRVFVSASAAPGQWSDPVLAAKARETLTDPVAALADQDTVVAWRAIRVNVKPGEFMQPTMGRVLSAAGQLGEPAVLGYGLTDDCAGVTGSSTLALLAWAPECGVDDLSVVTWSRSSRWHRTALHPGTTSRGDKPIRGVSVVGDRPVVSWQTEEVSVGIALPAPA